MCQATKCTPNRPTSWTRIVQQVGQDRLKALTLEDLGVWAKEARWPGGKEVDTS